VTTGSRENVPNKSELYVQAVRNAGGIAEFIYPGTGKNGLADHFDGFLIPGGKDISPMLYNEQQHYEISPEEEKRTSFELFLIREATIRKKTASWHLLRHADDKCFLPGVAVSGYTDSETGTFDHRRGSHGIEIVKNPYLACSCVGVNSSHHQAVKRPALGSFLCLFL